MRFLDPAGTSRFNCWYHLQLPNPHQSSNVIAVESRRKPRVCEGVCQTSLRRKPRQRRQGLYLANDCLKWVLNGLESNLARTSTGYNSMLVARSSRSSWLHMVEQWNILCGPCDHLLRGYRYDHWLGQTWSVRKFLGI